MTVYHRSLTAAGSLILGFWGLAVVLAPLLAPYDYTETVLPLASPGTVAPDDGTLWFGADHIGRDILSRVMFAGRHILGLIGLVVAVTYVLGLPIAWAATGESRLAPILAGGLVTTGRAVPVFISFLVLVFAFGPPYFASFAVAFALASLPGLRSEVALLRRSVGMSAPDRPTRKQFAAFFFVALLKRAAFYIAVAECIAFVGLGPFFPPATTFGGMLTETRQMALAFPHMVFIPIGALVSLLLGFNMLAGGLEGLLPTSLRKIDPARPDFHSSERSDARS